MNKSGLREFDIVEVITDPRQDEQTLATILDITEFAGEEAALIQYHYNECAPQTVCTKYMRIYP